MMRGVLVVQPQEVDAIVVAVRRSHDGMDVKFRGFGIGQKHAGMMVEFDEDHWALYPIVERARFIEATDPTEMRIGEVPFDFTEARRQRALRQRRNMGCDKSTRLRHCSADSSDACSPSYATMRLS